MNDDNKTNMTDTIKDLKDNPKEAMKEDYDQTKADMANMKDNLKEKITGDTNDQDEMKKAEKEDM
ncbi:hypothetical protein KW782_03710 [Candidatus Parcubacteria bacterium]|nr:hypothetical protein [Candidatus Parcubacteria bacterium]